MWARTCSWPRWAAWACSSRRRRCTRKVWSHRSATSSPWATWAPGSRAPLRRSAQCWRPAHQRRAGSLLTGRAARTAGARGAGGGTPAGLAAEVTDRLRRGMVGVTEQATARARSRRPRGAGLDPRGQQRPAARTPKAATGGYQRAPESAAPAGGGGERPSRSAAPSSGGACLPVFCDESSELRASKPCALVRASAMPNTGRRPRRHRRRRTASRREEESRGWFCYDLAGLDAVPRTGRHGSRFPDHCAAAPPGKIVLSVELAPRARCWTRTSTRSCAAVRRLCARGRDVGSRPDPRQSPRRPGPGAAQHPNPVIWRRW
jgi:hypothetical protein